MAGDLSLLHFINPQISQEDNALLNNAEEIKKVVFELNPNSACGPNGLTGCFYQNYWDIVGADIVKVVIAFFDGSSLPKSITHTNMVLLPKKDLIQSFPDLRPISLSNFLNKIISRIIHDRLEGFLPRLISQNQSGFVKGRNISENILLDQEIISDIRKRGNPDNVAIELDMTKAYDRIEWTFLIKVLEKMGFDNNFVDMIWRLIANNWYSIILNGQSHGFFHSTRGVKQGDPLSPALFILAADVLSRSLNHLFFNNDFKGFGLPKWSEQINHLAYADDTIIFASSNKTSCQLIMNTLHLYEEQSGQLINKGKSFFYLHNKAALSSIQVVEEVTGFEKGTFPLMYLGCPIGHAKMKKVHYSELITKIFNKLQAWKGKLLSFGGKVVLINHVLQSIPRYLLSAIKPPKCVIHDIHRI